MSSKLHRLQSMALLILLVWMMAFPLAASAQEKSLVWERFDVDILVKSDGTFDVAEHQRIHFTAGTFTFGFREIPINNFGRIDNWTLSDSSGNVYQLSTDSAQPYTFSVVGSSYSYVIRWYFPPATNESETYTLGYTVHDGLRLYDGGDQLWWKAIYSDRSFPVLDGRVNVTVPADIQEWSAYINSLDAKNSASATVLEGRKTIVFDLDRRLNSGQDFEVRVQFPHGVVAGTVQSWQSRADQQVAAQEAQQEYLDTWGPISTIGFGALGALFLFGGPALLYLLWYKQGRDKPVNIVADYLPEPPDDLPPGIAGVLLDEQADMEDIIATLVDLARRKAISITEEKQGRFLTSTDFIYRRERDDVKLSAFEAQLLKSIFGRKTEVELSDLKDKFYTKIPELKKALYEDVTERQLFVRNPESVRSQYGCLGVLLLGLAAVAGFALVGVFGDLTAAAFLPGFGMGVTAFGFIILSRFMPKKTDSGSETAARWQAFKRYLKDIDRYTDLEAQKEIWDRWLPYAIAFGVDKGYIRKFERSTRPRRAGTSPIPASMAPNAVGIMAMGAQAQARHHQDQAAAWADWGDLAAKAAAWAVG